MKVKPRQKVKISKLKGGVIKINLGVCPISPRGESFWLLEPKEAVLAGRRLLRAGEEDKR